MPLPLIWQNIKASGASPSPRSGHTLTTVGKQIILYGGLDNQKSKTGKIEPSKDVYVLKIGNNNSYEWRLQTTNGDIPFPRTNHAACAIGPDKMLVFGGYYSTNQRYNDTYILRTTNWNWSQPNNQKSGGEPKNTESKIGAPEPRANHTCTFWDNKVYVFGGHGGVSYQRKTFGDLFVLDCENFEWTEKKPKGQNGLSIAPEPRGGHTAAILPKNRLLFYGGWSTSSQFANMFIYDIVNDMWIDPELQYNQPRWNHCGVMVQATPTWKYFVFGGSTGNFDEGSMRNLGELSKDLFFLDVIDVEKNKMKWYEVKLESEENKPKAREQAAMVYESGDSKLILFGGWNNNWLGDLCCIPVGIITGPPYAIFDMNPKIGPYTGHTKIFIKGEGFFYTQAISVRFIIGGKTVGSDGGVQGYFIDENEIWCESPDVTQFGPKEAEVKVSIGTMDPTITSCKFQFFLNTKAENTLAFGPGLLCENPLDVDTVFYIQARDIENKNRKSGNDEFIVEARKVGAEEEAAIVQTTIEDKQDGTYAVRFHLKEEGEVTLNVNYKNEKGELIPIRGSPFDKVKFSAKAKVKNNELTGPGIQEYITKTVDEIENFISKGKENINIKNKNIQDDVLALLKVKENLIKINSNKDRTILSIDTLEQMIQTLIELQVGKESDLKRVLKCADEMKGLEKLSAGVEKDIAGTVKLEGEKCKENIVKFEEKLKNYFSDLKKKQIYSYITVETAFTLLETINQEYEAFQKKSEEFDYLASMFEFPDNVDPVHKNLIQIKNEINLITSLWNHIKKCQAKFADYKNNKWGEISVPDIDDEIKKLNKELTDIKNLDRKSGVFVGLRDDIKRWSTFIPLLGDLKDPSMSVEDNRHWLEVQKVINKEFTVEDATPLSVIWDLKLFEFKDQIEDITEKAKQESKMEKNLMKIDEKWKEVVFEQYQFKKESPIQLLKMSDENFETLEEHQVAIQNMSASKYVGYFETIVSRWRESLGQISDVTQAMGEVQKTWSFLENLFMQSEEVMKELHNEAEKFRDIDRRVKHLIEDGTKIKNILKFCTQNDVGKQLEQLTKELKECQKALDKFLNDKRKSYPRFYFVSVNDLLDILSNGNNPTKINVHMSKIFQAIERLELKEQGGPRPVAVGMEASVGKEKVPFDRPLPLEGKVEGYLHSTIKKMISTLTALASNSVKSYATTDKDKWLEQDPAQITILVNMIQWVSSTEDAFREMQKGNLDALKVALEKMKKSLEALIKRVQGDLETALRQKIMVLITMDTHSRDVIDRLIREKVRKAEEFQWQSQLKFYWDANEDDARISITDAVLKYGYEYLGNGPRLVITPLTDRIYVTATQALHLKMGCAPAGPAGTGKTESTKDLASAVGKACYVFNCSSEMNYESMGNIFKGLAASGCWGCFDEFNRLVPEVLSVCSVQFKSVTDAIKRDDKRFILQDDEIDLDKTCGVFITMNPGYLGRSELPEGLKALFRPITVVVPDLELICENMLMAEGFIEAKILATKFVTLYALCRDLLSKADHYDWGLRAIKSVLVVAGKFKRAEPNIKEQALLMRALRDFNLPKIVQQDLDIFHGLLGDLFPGVDIPRKVDKDFEAIIEKVCIEDKDKLHPDPDFILKVVQLKELLEIRHCVFVMGPPGAGKSKTWKVLARAQEKGGLKTNFVDLNPKTVSTRDLYGYIQTNKEWKDGLLSRVMRDLSNVPDTNPKWILLDGDLDANWIESMNSVMDDNKILTLASNERIFLKPHMRMIFEIRDLKFATPATVSRAGILYISDDKGSQWKSYVKSWISRNEDMKNNVEMQQNIQKLFDKYVEQAITYVFRNCKFLIPTSKMAMVVTICRAMDGFLKEKILNLEFIFVYVCIWSIGGCLNGGGEADDFRKTFNSFWRSYTEWKTVKFPSSGTIFDFYIDQTGEQAKTEPWTKIVPAFEYDDIAPMQSVTVPTPETVATTTFLRNLIHVGHPCLLIGLAGAGKTQLIKGLLKEINAKQPDRFLYQIINFNYYTESLNLQAMLEQTLEKKGGKAKGPRGKAKLIYFIDDLNMPALDKYNTQTSISLLRQLADYEHLYDIVKLTLLEIINTQTVASMNPTAGSFSVDPRYQRHFWTCAISMPDTQSLNIIYSAFMNGHFKKFTKPAVFAEVPNIIKSALSLHATVFEKFKKTAVNFHYEFNIRHLAGVFQGLLLAQNAQFQEPEKLIKLWIHESERVYGDRLVTIADLTAYKAIAADISKKNFGSKLNLNKFFAAQNPENIIFCTFTQGMGGDQSYDLMANDKLEHHIGDALRDYNDMYAAMDLVLFEDAMKHICKITRIIQQPSGHALLVGVGGSGKQSLSKLAAHISKMTFPQIVITTNYDLNALRTDLQSFYMKAGVKDEGLLFIFTDGQITNEKFLVYINDLLSSGEIADLYTQEDKDNIINLVRPKVKNDGKLDTPDNCWSWFIDKIKANLHMSLCFSPVGEAFRKRARQFPALINTTVIDWFQPWPEDALLNVASRFLAEVDLGTNEARASVIKFMPESFKVVNNSCRLMLEQERRYIYTTPKSFLELIKLFKTMLSTKRNELEKDKERYESGLVKLRETAEMVSKMEEELKIKQVDVEAKKVETDKIAEIVGASKSKVEAESSKANEEAAKCADIQKRVEEQRISAQRDLDAAEPLVQQAESALKDLNPKDFQQAKSFTSPPEGIPQTFIGCMNLLAGFTSNDMIEVDKNKKPKNPDWKGCQKMMKEVGPFMAKLLELKGIINEGRMPAQNVNPVRPLLQEEYFTPEKMKSKSNAAAGVCAFILNIIMYYDVVVTVEPKRKALKEATEQLEAANSKLAEINAIVAKLQAELNEVQSNFDKVMAEKNAVVAEAKRLEDRLSLAKRLIAALGSEDKRWEDSIKSLDKNLGVIVGDVLLSSAFVSYAGPFTKKYREDLIKGSFLKFLKDNKIPMSPNPEPLVLLIDEATKAGWNNQGLPPDQVSTENGTILTYTERYPLMIDPQLQGITWIREKEKKNGLQITRLGFKNIMNTLELAIEAGNSVLIENMGEKIDATLNPVIARNIIRKGNSKNKLIKIGDKTLTFNDKFRLFMHTKLANPHYPPEIQAEAALINFTVTEEGLGDQLLTLVVKKERPDLAKKKAELIQQQNEFKIKLKALEAGLLFKLANAQGDILADVDLIINLEESKAISVEIAEKVIIAKATEVNINEASERYRPVADRGALIFFLMNELYKIHTFYMYSLEAFVVVVNRAIDSISEKKKAVEKPEGEEPKEGEAPKEGEVQEGKEGEPKEGEAKEGEVVEKEEEATVLTPRSLNERVKKLTEVITKYSFNYVRRGLFERHKLIVAAMLTFRILVREGQKEMEAHKSHHPGGKDKKEEAGPFQLKNGLKETEVAHLFLGRLHSQPGAVPDMLKSWISDSMWSACLALQDYITPHFEGFTQSLDVDGLQWRKWYGAAQAEVEELPKNFKDLPQFYKLLLLRAMRPDRLPAALIDYISKVRGEEYVNQAPFDIFHTYKETDRATPIFFVLFPGVDPTPDVEKVGAEVGISSTNGKFVNISMGQGQEDKARDAIEKASKDGTWIMLQNLHLMESWLKLFEGYLEKASATAHPNFRCFISSEPPPLPDMKIIPESILQNCIKIANEAPQDLKANLRRAYNKFDQGRIDKSSKQNEYKSILFALCMFHSLIVGRKKFGSLGWSRIYNFNDGDLTICADVLHNYLEKYEQVPWDDIKYIYGEIMYGGHITDNWDRRTCNTYLKVLIRPALLQRDFSLVFGFKSPEAYKFDYEAYRKYIEEKLPNETPLMYSMHPNAEISYLTQLSETIFNTIIDVQGGVSKGGNKKDDDTVKKLEEYRKGLDGKQFSLIDIKEKAKKPYSPYDIVCFQECERMNFLTSEICRTLDELKQGLDGALNMTDAMDNLAKSIGLNKVPDGWAAIAYPSKKPLSAWYQDLQDRIKQLATWSAEMKIAKSIWISGLFNPMSFLTAIMQVTSRASQMPLDDMALQTNVTVFKDMSELPGPAENGFYVHGLYLEGAAWEVGGQGNEGYLIQARPKELHPKLPVVNVISVQKDLKKTKSQYSCPVYITSGRGPTYVFTANLQMQDEEEEEEGASQYPWILAGVALLMSDD